MQFSKIKLFFQGNVVIILFASLIWSCFPISNLQVQAGTFVDNSAVTFNGTNSNTTYDSVLLAEKQTGAAQPGTYTSTVENSTYPQAKWTNISWVTPQAYGKEYPNNQGSDSGYSGSNLSMNGNIGLWHFNESVTGSYADSSGLANNGNCATTCPTINTTTGIFSNAATFSTTATQYVNTSNGNSVKNLSTASIAISFQPSTVTGTKVLYEEAVGGANNPRISLRLVANKIQLQVRTTDAAATDTVLVIHPTLLVTTSWYHVVAVFDAVTDVHHIYLNGVDASATVAVNAFPNTNPNVVPRIGQNVAANLKFSGSIDEVALFNRVITATEVTNMYQRSANVRFQVQSCTTAACTTAANYRGPNNTNTTWFSELDNAGSGPPSIALTNAIIPQRQYFSYRIEFRNRITAVSTLTGLVNSVTITYQEPFTVAFAIRNSADTANLNTGCNFGTLSVSALSTCSYRLKITTNSLNGYTVNVQTSGDLSNGTNAISNASTGSGGSGGTLISATTVGTESYGAIFAENSATGGTLTLNSIFDAGNTNSVAINNISPLLLASSNGPNNPGVTDLANTILVTHNANISPVTRPGNYIQSITYTVVPNY